MAGSKEYVEKAGISSVKKFNIDFLKKARNLFASLTIISYLWGVKQLNKDNYDNDFNRD